MMSVVLWMFLTLDCPTVVLLPSSFTPTVVLWEEHVVKGWASSPECDRDLLGSGSQTKEVFMNTK